MKKYQIYKDGINIKECDYFENATIFVYEWVNTNIPENLKNDELESKFIKFEINKKLVLTSFGLNDVDIEIHEII